MKPLGKDSLVSIGTLVAAILMTAGVVRAFEAQAQQLATLNARVDSVASSIDEIRHRQDTTDERWLRVLDDLGKIKERLGIVENRPK